MLDALDRAGGGRFRGVRYPVAWHADPAVRLTAQPTSAALMGDPAVREGAATLAEAGFSLDVWAGHTRLGEVHDLARAVPGLTIILDHVGGPIGVGPHAGRRAEVLIEWTAAMRRLAELPNLVVKLGGLGQHVGGFAFDQLPAPPPSERIAEAWRPHAMTCIDLFGPARCMFESNFPVDKEMVGYRSLWNAFKRLSAGFSEDEKSALFCSIARRIYRLYEPVERPEQGSGGDQRQAGQVTGG